MGYRDRNGLHFAGRSQWIIKPAGYQVFPAEVEHHLCALEDKVALAGVVGVEHRLISEGIVAFVERKPGAELDARWKPCARGANGTVKIWRSPNRRKR